MNEKSDDVAMCFDKMNKRIGIYIHIPFCIKKCEYCDFLSFPLAEHTEGAEDESQGKLRTYLKALHEEIRTGSGLFKDYTADTIFIGGGTPSLLSGSQMRGLLDEIKENFALTQDAEISMEMNPGTANREWVEAYLDAGINRVSVGLQSACDRELKLLGRIHTFEQFEKTYGMLRECGCRNINVDIMSALPDQTTETYGDTLSKVTALKPEHISAYSLILEEGTPFYDRFGAGDGQGALPDEDADRQMYAQTLEKLAGEGYHRYEISNYALEGYECRHNLKYWHMEEYIGFGLGSASYYGGRRYKNTENMENYLKRQSRETARQETVLTTEDEMEEFMFLGLRTMGGVSLEEFHRRFGVSMRKVYGEVIEKYVDMQLLEIDDYIRLTERGIDVSNVVMAEFLL